MGWKHVWHRNGTALFVVKLRDVISGLPLLQHMLQTESSSAATRLKTKHTHTYAHGGVLEEITWRWKAPFPLSEAVSEPSPLLLVSRKGWNGEVLVLSHGWLLTLSSGNQEELM